MIKLQQIADSTKIKEIAKKVDELTKTVEGLNEGQLFWQNLIKTLEVIIWPIAIILILYLFKKQIGSIFDRFESANVSASGFAVKLKQGAIKIGEGSSSTLALGDDGEMIAKSGARLINNKAIDILKKKLMRKVSLITPNIPEAEILTNLKIKNTQDMIKAAQFLLSIGAKNVLIKGGHLKSRVVKDILVNKKEINFFSNKKFKTNNTHGTGCTLSSAITTFFSCGKLLNKSCDLGIKYVNQSIRSNPNYGKGHGPINHLNSITINKKFR